MNTSDETARDVTGQVKWFDPGKGFGFILDGEGGPDILLHINVLRAFGQSSIGEGVKLTIRAARTARGLQAIEVLSIEPTPVAPGPGLVDILGAGPDALEEIPLQPARVKWFDKAKGFGFANVFGESGDVFLHIDVLRLGGFADLAVGEAIALRVVDGKRGRMAAQILGWDRAHVSGQAKLAEAGERPVDGLGGLSPVGAEAVAHGPRLAADPV